MTNILLNLLTNSSLISMLFCKQLYDMYNAPTMELATIILHGIYVFRDGLTCNSSSVHRKLGTRL